jgi:hypothetical protein
MQNLDIFGGASEPVEGKPRDGYKGTEGKAINWYATNNNCILQLSAYPTITFIDRNTREQINEQIGDFVDQYKSWKKEDTKERARQRRVAKAQAENGGRVYGG